MFISSTSAPANDARRPRQPRRVPRFEALEGRLVLCPVIPELCALNPALCSSHLTGTVFSDANRNGILDPAEPGIAGQTVLVNGAQAAVSSASGAYCVSEQQLFGIENVIRLQEATPVEVTAPPQTVFTRSFYDTGLGESGAVVGEFDGRRGVDIAVANRGGDTVSILFNDGTGNFNDVVDITVGREPSSLAVADFNGDGAHDLAVGYPNLSFITVLLNDGQGAFGTRIDRPSGTGPSSIVAADFDLDGHIDLASSNQFSRSLSIFWNDPTHEQIFPQTSTILTEPGNVLIDVAKLFLFPSILVTNNLTGTLLVYEGGLSRNFGLTATIDLRQSFNFNPRSVVDIVVADIDRDGIDDVTLASEDFSVGVFFGGPVDGVFGRLGSPVFPDLSAASLGVGLGDVDGDQDLDILTFAVKEADEFDIEPSIRDLFVLRNRGNRQISEQGSLTISGFGGTGLMPVATGDFDRNGLIDAVVAGDDFIVVYMNNFLPGGDYLFVRSFFPQEREVPGFNYDFGVANVVRNASRAVGDYNGDLTVDEKDYDVWQANFGRRFGAGMSADGNGNGVIDAADYTVWRDNVGRNLEPPAAPLQIEETEPNDSLATAQGLETAAWTRIFNPRVTASETVPYVTIRGTGDGVDFGSGTFDYYAFQVAESGVVGTFDIDEANADLELFLFSANGALLASKDGARIIDAGSTSEQDPFLTYRFTTAGSYVIGVGRFESEGDPGGIVGDPLQLGDRYTLHISIEGHPEAGAGLAGPTSDGLQAAALEGSAFESLSGDFDLDGAVDQRDLDLVLEHWGANTDATPPGWLAEPPRGGVIDQEELDAVLLNWGREASRASDALPTESLLLEIRDEERTSLKASARSIADKTSPAK